MPAWPVRVRQVKRLVRALRARWPGVAIEVRADTGFAVPELYAYCEAAGVTYTLGLVPNPKLEALAAPLLARAQAQQATTGAKVRVVLHAAAYWLLDTLRRWLVAAGTERLQLDTLRRRLLKIGGRVRELLTRVRLHLASSHPGEHYWWPLDGAVRPDAVAFQDAYFHREVGAEALRRLLRRRGITRVWQFEELRLAPDLEQDPIWCTFRRSGGETYWTSRALDWLVYASHERSLTIAGGGSCGPCRRPGRPGSGASTPTTTTRIRTPKRERRPRDARQRGAATAPCTGTVHQGAFDYPANRKRSQIGPPPWRRYPLWGDTLIWGVVGSAPPAAGEGWGEWRGPTDGYGGRSGRPPG